MAKTMVGGRTTYPGYDLESLIFDPDPDDPDFNNGNNIDFKNSNCLELHIRHSKSDPVLLLNMHSFCCPMDLDNQNNKRGSLSPGCYQDMTPTWDKDQYHSLEDLSNQTGHDNSMLTLEGLRNHYNSCFTCGVSWYADHVSLDCAECGGYAMQRPCPQCDGQCDSIWRRNLSASHQAHKAQWEGECKVGSRRMMTSVLHVDNKLKMAL